MNSVIGLTVEHPGLPVPPPKQVALTELPDSQSHPLHHLVWRASQSQKLQPFHVGQL